MVFGDKKILHGSGYRVSASLAVVREGPLILALEACRVDARQQKAHVYLLLLTRSCTSPMASCIQQVLSQRGPAFFRTPPQEEWPP